jgi:transmembrane sensor
MNRKKPDHERLLDEAIDLIIRRQNDPDNPVSNDMIRAWRARSPAHEDIWAKVSGAHGSSGKVLTERVNAERQEKSKVTRRKFVIGGAAGVGAFTAGSLFLPDAIVWARADHMTDKGEIRRFELKDGSVATLGPESALALDYTPGRRRIELLRGMSYFEVREDAGRPFVVETSLLTATALGTAFDISDDAGLVSVGVAHGIVEARADDTTSAPARLAAGDWLAFNASAGGIDRGKREVGQIGAWRDAQIIAEQEPVSALVARIGRWYPGRVVIADPAIGSQKVSGIFDASDPRRALEAVVLPAGGQVREISSYLIVISPI